MKIKLILIGFIVIAMTSCAKIPTQDISDAKTAIENAKLAECDKYATTEFKAAQDSMNVAMIEIQKQQSSFVFKRNYTQAKRMLAVVGAVCDLAKQDAVVNKEKMKTEVTTLLAQDKTALEEVKVLLKKAPAGKEGKAVLSAIESDLKVIENSIAEVSTNISTGDFMIARDKAIAVNQKLSSIKTELTTAISKTSKKHVKK